MAEQPDMNAPVTRGELREDLAATRAELREEIAATRDVLREEIAATRDVLREEIAATRGELREEIAATRGELREELAELRTELRSELEKLEARFDTKLELWAGALLARINDVVAASEQRILAELARHTAANQESVSTQITVVDEKYRDLPERVARLERKGYKRSKRSGR